MEERSLYDDVGRHLKRLLLLDPYYALFMIALDKQETTAVPTMAVATDGVNIKLLINPDFWFKLTEPQRTGLCIHEVLHLCHMHLFTSDRYPNSKLDNIACDLEINQYIPRDYLPKEGIFLDEINSRYNLNLEPKQGRDYYYKNLQDKIPEDFDLGDAEHFWEMVKGLPEADQQVIANQIGHLMQQASEMAESQRPGSTPGNIAALIALRKRPPKFDWKKHMRTWAGHSSDVYLKRSLFKPNPYFQDNPSSKIKLKKNILCAIDTSGSVSLEELGEFMSEIYNLWKFGHTITILCADTTIYDPYIYKGENDIKIHGRGGTYFTPILEWYNSHKEYSAMIYFTDGYAELPPNANKPMLWVITSSGSIEAIKEHNGKILKIEK